MNRYILLLSALISIGLSTFFSMTELGGFSQSQVSELYSTSITPAALTFSIWSVIYLSWFILGILSLLGKTKISQKNAYLLAATQILSSFWLLPAQSLWIGTSFIIMSGLVFLLTLLFFNSSEEEKYIKIINALFYGWILVAFLANLHIFLIDSHVYFFPIIFGVFSLLAGGIYNIYLLKRHDAWIINLVYIWALIGVFIQQTNQHITFTAIFLVCLLASLLGLHKYSFFKNMFSSLK